MKKLFLLFLVLVLLGAIVSCADETGLIEPELEAGVENDGFIIGYVDEPFISVSHVTYDGLLNAGFNLYVSDQDHKSYTINIQKSDPLPILGIENIEPDSRTTIVCRTCWTLTCRDYFGEIRCGMFRSRKCVVPPKALPPC